MRTVLIAVVLLVAAFGLAVMGLGPAESKPEDAFGNWSMQQELEEMSEARRKH